MKPYANYIFQSVLLLDNFISRKKPSVRKSLQDMGTDLLLSLGSSKCILQPWDFVILKFLKSGVHDYYVKWTTENTVNENYLTMHLSH